MPESPLAWAARVDIGPVSIPAGGVVVGVDHVPVGVGVLVRLGVGVVDIGRPAPSVGLISVGLGSANVGNWTRGQGIAPQGENMVPHWAGGTTVLMSTSAWLVGFGVGVLVGVSVGVGVFVGL